MKAKAKVKKPTGKISDTLLKSATRPVQEEGGGWGGSRISNLAEVKESRSQMKNQMRKMAAHPIKSIERKKEKRNFRTV